MTIIGAGPGGYVAAIRAAQLGAKVCVIEKENLGGVCLNKGCIPTKTLLKSAGVIFQIEGASDFGIDVGTYHIDFAKIISRKNEVVQRLNKGIELLFKARKIELIKGRARITSPEEIEVSAYPEGHRNRQIPQRAQVPYRAQVKTKNIIIATGSRPLELPGFKFDGKKILSSDDILNINQIPQILLIVGGGVIGCEFATFFNRLGSEVTIVEMMQHILPNEDREIARRLEGAFKKQGITVLTKTKAETDQIKPVPFRVAETVLVCVGRLPNTADLGLEDVGIELEKGYLAVNPCLETNIPHIFAIGDCVGGHLLAHVASYEGIIAAENALGAKLVPTPKRGTGFRVREVDYSAVPNCIFTHPEVASVGLTEEKAKEEGREVKVGKFPFSALGKAQAAGEVEGLVKIVVDKSTDRVLGAQILGEGATELIAELTLAVKLRVKGKDIADTIHAHPTMAEAVMEAAHSLHDGAIHLP